MQRIDTYLIKWYGPFNSKEELRKWENKRPEVFNLYIFQARKKRNKDKYYCGMTFKQTVGMRMRNHDHHIHDFENEQTEFLQIWIGTIANIKAKESDVRVCENLITSKLAVDFGAGRLENCTNMNPPLNDVYMINEWWRTNGNYVQRKSRGSIPAVIPEVMVYYSDRKSHELYGIDRLKYFGDLL